MRQRFANELAQQFDIRTYGLVQGDWEAALRRERQNSGLVPTLAKRIDERVSSDEDWEAVLQSTIDDICVTGRMAKGIEEEVDIHSKGLSETLGDYVKYSHDIVRTRASIFATLVSALAIIATQLITQSRLESLLIVLLIAVAILLFVLELLTVPYFRCYGPHEYAELEKWGLSPTSWFILLLNSGIIVIVFILDLRILVV